MKPRLFPAFALLLASASGAAISLSGAAPAPPALPGELPAPTTSSTNAPGVVAVPEVPDSGVTPPGDNLNAPTNATTLPEVPTVTPPSTPRGRPSISVTNQPPNLRTGAVNRPKPRALPAPLRERLLELIDKPHTYRPQGVYPPLRGSSQLTGFYLLDPNGAGGTPTAGSNSVTTTTSQRGGPSTNTALSGVARVFQFSSFQGGTNLASNPTSSDDSAAFTDVAGLPAVPIGSSGFAGWLVHDLAVPVAAPAVNGVSAPGSMTDDDATALAVQGTGNNVPGAIFTIDGNAPSGTAQSTNGTPATQIPAGPNTVSLYSSAGVLMPFQRNDAHAYQPINPQTSWVNLAGLSNTPAAGPGGASATNGTPTSTTPTNAGTLTLVPSGVAREILLDVYIRKASFEPNVLDLNQRFSDAYHTEMAKVDTNQDGTISTEEADAATANGSAVFLDASAYNRFIVAEQPTGRPVAIPGTTILEGVLQSVTEPVPATAPDPTQE